MLQKRIIFGRFKWSEKTVSPTVKMNQIQISISFLLLVSLCLTVRAAPLTDQLKGSAKAMSEREKTGMVKRNVDLESGTLDVIKSSPIGPMFRPDDFIFGDSGPGNDWGQVPTADTDGSR